MNLEKSLDALDWRIVEALQEDGRLSWSELGRRVGLSQPAVAERVRRLEEAGVILGYHAVVDPARLGLGIRAFVRLRLGHGLEERLYARVALLPEVLECHRITGEDCLILQVAVASVQHLEQLLDQLKPFGMASTSIVLSSVVSHRPIACRAGHRG